MGVDRKLRGALIASSLVLACSAGAEAQVARADTPRGPALNWVRLPGAESCIAPVELGARVEERLGRPVFVRMPDAIIVIEGQIGPAPDGGYAASIRVSDPDGRLYGARDVALPDPDCTKLDELVTLIVAVTIRNRGSSSGIALPAEIAAELDALFAGEPAALDPSELPSAQVASTPDRPAAPASEPSALPAPEPTRWQLALGAGWLGATGAQFDGTLGPTAHVRLGLRGVGSAVLSGAVGLPQSAALADDDAVQPGELRLQPWVAALALCAPELGRASRLSLCGHLGLGVLHAEASAFAARNREIDELWLELGPELSVRPRLLGPVYVRLAVRAPIRLVRPRFDYVRQDATSAQAFYMALVGIAGELAVAVDVL